MDRDLHLHFHIRATEAFENQAVAAILALMHSLKIEPSTVAGKIEPAPCSITRAISDWQSDMERRGCKNTSVRSFGKQVTRLVEHAGWSSPDQITLAGAIEYLSARRKAGWSGPTHDGAVSAMRNFGAFLTKTGVLAANPLEHLEASEETGGQGARYIDHDLSAEVAAMQRLPNLWAQKRGNVLESGRGDADTHGVKVVNRVPHDSQRTTSPLIRHRHSRP